MNGWTQQRVDAYNANRSKHPEQPSDAFEGLESELHGQIIDELQRRRWYFVHSRWDRATTQAKGVPDFVIAARASNSMRDNPVTYWIEVKRKGEKLTQEQNITRHVLTALGHKHAVVYSLQDFITAING